MPMKKKKPAKIMIAKGSAPDGKAPPFGPKAKGGAKGAKKGSKKK